MRNFYSFLPIISSRLSNFFPYFLVFSNIFENLYGCIILCFGFYAQCAKLSKIIYLQNRAKIFVTSHMFFFALIVQSDYYTVLLQHSRIVASAQCIDSGSANGQVIKLLKTTCRTFIPPEAAGSRTDSHPTDCPDAAFWERSLRPQQLLPDSVQDLGVRAPSKVNSSGACSRFYTIA